MKAHHLEVVAGLRLLDRLSPFDPLLIGTPPLGLATADSDIDIACHADPVERFGRHAAREFGDQTDFRTRIARHLAPPACIASFSCSGWVLEIFCQPLETRCQAGVIHFQVEQRLLRLAPGLRAAVLELKRAGHKTEPAFAQLLGLAGDPYAAMLTLATRTDDELVALIGANTRFAPLPPGLGRGG